MGRHSLTNFFFFLPVLFPLFFFPFLLTFFLSYDAAMISESRLFTVLQIIVALKVYVGFSSTFYFTNKWIPHAEASS
jgi:hypothetical protein